MALEGIQLGLLRPEPFEKAVRLFCELQDEFRLQSCEVHLETSLYESSCRQGKEEDADLLASLRGRVSALGVHLPFMDINLLSDSPRISAAGRSVLEESLSFAARARADYVVFHARGTRQPTGSGHRDLSCWADVIAALAGRAGEYGLIFCLENADDLKDPAAISGILEEVKGAGLCLDIGHLFERSYSSSPWGRRLLYLNDRLSPSPFSWKKGLPFSSFNDWGGVLAALSARTRCVHIHNHDGTCGHRPLRRGKVDFRPLTKWLGLLEHIPLIIEADYRKESWETVREDLRYLGRLINRA